MKKVQIMFFFALKASKKINLCLGRFWVGFLRSRIGLPRFLRCFLGILSKKRVENGFIVKKSKTLFFSITTMAGF